MKPMSGKVTFEGKIIYRYGKGPATGATEDWAIIEPNKDTLSSLLTLLTKKLEGMKHTHTHSDASINSSICIRNQAFNDTIKAISEELRGEG